MPTAAPIAPATIHLDRLRSALPPPLRRKLRRARDLSKPQPEEQLPTAIQAIDRLLPGGLPRGRLVEIVGRRSSGRFSLLLSVLATATGTGDCAALVDLGDGFDSRTAALAGVDLERLLWLRPRHIRAALAGAEISLHCGFPLIILDLGLPPVPGGRGTEPSWLRLARAAAIQSSVVLVSSPYRASGTAATAVLEAAGALPLWHGETHPLLAGSSCRMRKTKQRGASAGEESEAFRLRVPETAAARLFDPAAESPSPLRSRSAAVAAGE